MGKTVTVIGNYSGRNAGDAAILGGLLRDISERYPDTEFLIPTISPSFVREEYKKYNVIPISLMPWNLSAKIFGVPVFKAIAHSDLVLITDAILFDRKLFNPLHNYLSTLSLLVPYAKKKALPVVLYNVSLGPIFTRLGKRCLERVVKNSDLLILRDQDSIDLLRLLSLSHHDIRVGADCALGTESCSKERLNEIVMKEALFTNGRPVIGFNINSYIDVYVKGKSYGIGKSKFISVIADTIDRIMKELPVEVVFIVTQIMDLPIVMEAVQYINSTKGKQLRYLSNKDYNYQEIASVMSLFELFVGMRTHSLILASSMGTPVVGIIAYPKSRGFLESIGQKGRMIEFKDFSSENLLKMICSTWEKRDRIRGELLDIIEREKLKAKRSAEWLRPFI